MSADLAQYRGVRQRMRPGDVIAFSGATGVSPVIKAFTGSAISHVAMVRQGSHDGSDVTIAESTIEAGRNGAQTNPLEARLANYDGRAWWLPLAEDVRRQVDWQAFYKFIGAADGHIQYDTPGLFQFLARSIPLVGPLVFQREHANAMFCSGYDVAVLEAAGVLRGINYSKVTPQDLCEMKLYRECVQILGAPAAVARFNSIP